MRRRKKGGKKPGQSEKQANCFQRMNETLRGYDAYAVTLAPWRINGQDDISSGFGGFMSISLYLFVGLYLVNKLHEMAFFSRPAVS